MHNIPKYVFFTFRLQFIISSELINSDIIVKLHCSIFDTIYLLFEINRLTIKILSKTKGTNSKGWGQKIQK